MSEQNYPEEGYAPGYDEARVFGDANSDSIGVSKITVDRILKMNQPDHCLALYVFFCYTARWQKTTQAKCTVGYASKAMGWSERVTQRAKAQLVKAGLVDNVKHVDPITGQVKGWYIRVRYIVRLCIHPATEDRVVEVHPAKSPGGGNLAPKCLGTGSRNALKTGNREEVVEEKEKKGRAAYEEFKAYWNENVGEQSPQIRMYSEKRARELSARLKNPDWRENWKAAVDKIKDCPFLTGENDRKWTADAEFFLRPDTVAKIIEGKYDAKEEDPYKKYLC